MLESPTFKRLLFPLLILIALPLTIFLVFHSTDTRQHASEEVIAYLVPNTPMAKSGETITYTLAVDSHTTPLKSAQVNLTYPSYKGEIVNVKTDDSPFNLPLEEIKGNGILKLARETSTPVYGLQQIATIQLKASSDLEATDVTLAPGTYVLTLENTTLSPQDVKRQFPPSTKDEKGSILTQLILAIRKILP